MRIVHFADVHLGYRAYHRLTPQGVNQREQDVQDAFNEGLRRIVQIEPDLILMAGDLFHSVRPSNLVLQRTFRALRGLRERCGAPIVMIAGNHESPRSAEAGCILRLFENIPDVHVRDAGYEAVRLPALDTTIFCLPHRGLGDLAQYQVAPDPNSRTNILMLHGTLEGIGRDLYDGTVITRSQVLSDDWDYIACGHYHIHHRLADNAYYCGSTEFTSFNPWEEVGSRHPPKGLVEYDTDARRLTHHAVPTRQFVDLPAIPGTGLSAAEITERISSAAAAVRGGLKEKIVRLVVSDVPRKVQVDVDHGRLREIRAEAFHFELSLRAPHARAAIGGPAPSVVRRTLEQEWRDHVDAMTMLAGVEREAFHRLGAEYLAQVSAESVPPDSAAQ